MNAIRSMHDEVIEALTMGVRFLSVSQIAHQWCEGDYDEAAIMVRELEQNRLVVQETHLVHPELEVAGPEFVWVPGDAEPDFAPVAYRLRKRWSDQKQMIELVFPEKSACQRYGGTRIRPRASELSHDLHLASVYLLIRDQLDAEQHWVSGDTLRSDGCTGAFGGSVPDAVLMNRQGSVEQIIEGGGGYSRSKLESIHRDYSGSAYEIW